MDIRDEQTTSTVCRFTVLGREFSVEAALVQKDHSINVGLYENGRLIFSETEPSLQSIVSGDPQAGLKVAAEELEAQINEMFSHLQGVEEGGSAALTHLLAEVFASRGIYDESERLHALGVNLDPTDSKGLYQYGLCLTQVGEYGKACEAFSDAVSQKPLYADYRNAYGLALAWSGKIIESRKQIDQALELNTYYADAYYCLGMVCLFNGIKNIEKEYAQDFVNRAKGLFEKSTLVNAIYLTDEYNQAIQTLDSGAVREAFSYFKANRDLILRREGNSYDELRTNFLAALQSTGKNAIDAQISLLSRQLRENPSYVDVSFQLAIAHFKSSLCQWNTGMEQLKAVLELNPELYKAMRAHDVSLDMFNEIENVIAKMESSPEKDSKD